MDPVPTSSYAEEEDAAQLKLGADFSTAQCMMCSEIEILLKHRQESMEDSEAEVSPVFLQTLEYVQRFSRFKNRAAVKEIRACLTKRMLVEFEIASLCNLGPEEVEEARALVPSLIRFDDDEVQAILNDLSNYKFYAL
mmetsp:Transcript_94/g.175  ORF Transcript_94/g.175 Transcript_94/m.175 type:complete len:138 (-) Transcript_94:165-578(-)|eukprot:CAMPEP_0177637226 /NCGR_PEP_ID=MMETSP0447-20121125/4861_1 /TAXON_ID=0 /ORGANISM="Stygamoeba regulata, Strain BSH-02190019" /LENGTH=137 /DNA_ID=CAMNT_0019139145 /DNA_START=100 /DNA_END=513 /DNA_ORIENTATION=+